MISKAITVNPYVTEVYFIKGSTAELAKDIKRFNKKHKVNFPIDDYSGNTEEYLVDGYHIVVVAINTEINQNPEYLVDTLAHEAVHATNLIFKHGNIKLDVNNDEPQAYLLGWFVGELYKFITKQTRKQV
jgi:hypothetical protein